MRLKLTKIGLAMALFASLLVGCLAEQESVAIPPEPRINDRVLINAIELPRTRLKTVDQSGLIADTSSRFRLNIDNSSPTGMNINIQVDDAAFSQISFRTDNYPSLDLSTIATYARRSENGIEFLIEIKYGEESDCFVDDDGRNRISIHINQSDFVLHTMTFSNCEPMHTEVH